MKKATLITPLCLGCNLSGLTRQWVEKVFPISSELSQMVTGFFYSYFQGSWKIEAFSLCVFTSTKSPRGPPWNEGHRPKVRHETSVFEVPAQEQHEHSFYSSSTNTFITCSLYTVHRYRTSLGAPDLRARLG